MTGNSGEAASPSASAPIYSRAEVVERSGLDGNFIDRLCELGIMVADADGRFTEGDLRRARILHAVDAAGLPIDAVSVAMRQGQVDLGFVDDPAYGLFTGLAVETFADVAARTGVPVELLFAIRESMGAPQPAPGDRLRELELGAVPAVEMLHRNGVRQHVIDRMLRTYGESLRRVSEVEADWWMSDVIQPILDSGAGLSEIGPRTAEFSNHMQPLTERLVLTLYHGHQANAWMRNFFESFEAGITALGLHRPVERPPAICFLDLTGYTRLTEERGDAAAAELAARLSRIVQKTSTSHGGKPIKWLGDGVMFHFREPGSAVVAALEMVDAAAAADLPRAHVGVHAGPVLFQDGDYFGRTVNVAARIADYARQGEVLVSQDVIDAALTGPAVLFQEIGPVELKGISDPVRLHVARRA